MGVDIWFNVEIEDGPEDWLDNLPDFELINGDKWDHGWDYEPIEGATEPPYMKRVDKPTTYACSGEGRYGDEQNITEWARHFTSQWPECRVTIHTEWHADGYGEENNVYRRGILIPEESEENRMVPANLSDLVEEAKRVLELYENEEPRSISGFRMSAARLAGPLRKLVEGLKR